MVFVTQSAPAIINFNGYSIRFYNLLKIFKAWALILDYKIFYKKSCISQKFC